MVVPSSDQSSKICKVRGACLGYRCCLSLTRRFTCWTSAAAPTLFPQPKRKTNSEALVQKPWSSIRRKRSCFEPSKRGRTRALGREFQENLHSRQEIFDLRYFRHSRPETPLGR